MAAASGSSTQLTANGAALAISSLSDQQITAFLPSGYSGLFKLKVSNAGGQHTVNIMTAAAAPPPTISLSAGQASFSYTLGDSTPASQTVSITNTGGGTLTWSATSGSSWLMVSPSSGVGAGTLTLSVNPAGLTAQTYNGAITFSASGATNSPQTISVVLTVNPAPRLLARAFREPGQFLLNLWGQHSGIAGSQHYECRRRHSYLVCNLRRVLADGVPGVRASAPERLMLGINHSRADGVQTYNGAITLRPRCRQQPANDLRDIDGQRGAPPPVTVSGVANAASWTGGAVAPGELVVIGGAMLGPSTGVSGSVDPSTGKMVSQLAGTTVLFNGIAAPLLYVSATQVNAIVPYETAGCTQTVLQVRYQGVLSSGTALPCASAAPGIFTFNASGTGQAAAANQDGTFNGPSAPAAKGSYVTVYFTGGGQTNPAGVTGSITGSTLKWLTQGASVSVGGVAATVAFDGAAPTFVDGVLQLNIQLSGSTPSGNALPVVIKVGSVSSPGTATLAVQ